MGYLFSSASPGQLKAPVGASPDSAPPADSVRFLERDASVSRRDTGVRRSHIRRDAALGGARSLNRRKATQGPPRAPRHRRPLPRRCARSLQASPSWPVELLGVIVALTPISPTRSVRLGHAGAAGFPPMNASAQRQSRGGGGSGAGPVLVICFSQRSSPTADEFPLWSFPLRCCLSVRHPLRVSSRARHPPLLTSTVPPFGFWVPAQKCAAEG